MNVFTSNNSCLKEDRAWLKDVEEMPSNASNILTDGLCMELADEDQHNKLTVEMIGSGDSHRIHKGHRTTVTMITHPTSSLCTKL